MVNKTKTKQIWKGIKQLISLKSRGSTSPIKLIIDGWEIKNDKDIANQLNFFFFFFWKRFSLSYTKIRPGF